MKLTSLLFIAVPVLVLSPALDAAEAAPKAVFPELIKDLGSVPRGEKLKASFQVTNEGDAPLVIDRVETDCVCTVLDFDRTIAAGATGAVRAEVNTELLSGPSQTQIAVHTSDPDNQRVLLTLKVDSLMAVGAEPGYFRYIVHQHFRPVPGQEGTLKQTLYSPKGEDFGITSVVSDFPYIAATVHEALAAERLPKWSGRQWIVEATISPEAPVGALSGYVRVFVDHPSQKVVPFPVSGFVRPLFAATPTSVQLPKLEIADESVFAQVHIKQFATEPIHIEKVTVDIPRVTADIKPIEDGRSYQLRVTFPPDMPKGSFRGTVTLQTDSDLQRVFEVPIQGTVH